MYAVALSPGGDTLFAAATVDRTRHTWGAVKPVCGYSFLTLHNTKKTLYGIARDKGLFSMNPDQDVIRPEPVGDGFHAVGHLAMDRNETNAYASAAATSDSAMRGYYDQVVKLSLTAPAPAGITFVCGGLV